MAQDLSKPRGTRIRRYSTS